MKPQRIVLSRKKGFSLHAHSHTLNGLFAVNVARPGTFGNPYKVGEMFSAKKVVKMFERFRVPTYRAEELAYLRGKNLACWCKLGEPCHADVLLKIANE